MRKVIRRVWEFLNESLLGHVIGLLLLIALWVGFMYLMGWYTR